MKSWVFCIGSLVGAAAISTAVAQTPVLSTIAAPYAAIQAQVTMAGSTYPSGTVAYGPAGTPLVLSGSELGDNGTVWFFAYKNGVLDTRTAPAEGVVTLWTASQISLKVPSGAVSGLVQVVTGDKASNPLPFVVTQGTYSASCPTGPSSNQVQITTNSLPDGTATHSYSVQLNATGGSNSYTWSLYSGSLPSGLSLSSSGIISGTPGSASNPVTFTVQVVDTSTPQQHDEATLSLEVATQPEAGSSGSLYSFSIQNSGGGAKGYDPVGNVTGYTDSVNGAWAFTYDSLSRLATGTGSQDNNIYPNYCWQYDNFGNREAQTSSATAYSPTSNGGANACPVGSGPSWGASYNSSNQISGGLYGYDQAGNIYADSTTGNSYLYDGEGQVCAMQQSIDGTTTMTGYLYDAEGHRVAKGSLTLFTCDTNPSDTSTYNGFTVTSVYVIGPGGEQLTEMTNTSATQTPSWQWAHTNLFAPGLSATYDYDPSGQSAGWMYFQLSDWLGTRRQQTDYAGNPCLNFTGLPYGDGLTPIPIPCFSPAEDATEHHFTGKERDTESGNDYFGARYYASTMGRWLSPDWSAKEDPVPYAKLDDPQSLNLYGYVLNNPLARADADGHEGPDAASNPFALPFADPFASPYPPSTVGPALQQLWNNTVDALVPVYQSVANSVSNLLNSSSNSNVPASGESPATAPAPATTSTPDFVVTPGGTAVATDPNRVAGSLAGAPGVTSTPIQSPGGEQGTLHSGVQTPNGPVDVRTMSGSKTNAPRTVITHPGTNNPKTPDGKATNDKGQSHIPSNSKLPKPQP